MPTGPNRDGKVSMSERLEGKVTMFTYRSPEGRSTLEIFRNYESGLTKAGFTTLFTCRGEQCGEQIGLKGLGYLPNSEAARYLATKLKRPQGDVYVALNKDLDNVGHVAVYEILFDTGKADLRPASGGALKEIAALMARSPTPKLYVVGHTDNVGALAANRDLSTRRAQAVVTALTTTYNVAPARLQADGVGPLAPVASNDDEAGRARNRRVELVKQ